LANINAVYLGNARMVGTKPDQTNDDAQALFHGNCLPFADLALANPTGFAAKTRPSDSSALGRDDSRVVGTSALTSGAYLLNLSIQFFCGKVLYGIHHDKRL
jgi:hypothetical protein